MRESLLLLEHERRPGRIPQLKPVWETDQQGNVRIGDAGKSCCADAGGGGARVQPDVSGQIKQPHGEATVLAQRKVESPDPQDQPAVLRILQDVGTAEKGDCSAPPAVLGDL